MPLEDIPEIFSSLDKVGDGKIDVAQVGACLRVAGLTPTESILKLMLKQWEGQTGARLSVEEVTPIYSNVKKQLGPDESFERIHDCLAHYDREGNGFVSLADLRYILTSAGEKLSDKEVSGLLFGFVITDESKVSITEFVKHIQSL